jgi:CBS domain-containing protein
MNARELMTPDPQVVTADDPVYLAAQLMRDFGIGLLPVVDNRVHLHPMGVITDRDIAMRCVADRFSTEQNVEDFMTLEHLSWVEPEADAMEVMRVMERNQLRRVLVVDRGRLVGVIAQADLALKAGPREPLMVEEMLERISAPAVVAV